MGNWAVHPLSKGVIADPATVTTTLRVSDVSKCSFNTVEAMAFEGELQIEVELHQA